MFNKSREVSPRRRQMRRLIAMRIICGVLAGGLWAAAPVMAIISKANGDGTHACVASQPVYDTLGLVVVGNWNVILAPGQSVLLPDGDTATCQNGELLVH